MKQADITSKVSYGSNLLNRCLIFRVLPEIYGGIAQLGEHLLCKAGGQRFDPAYLHQRLEGITEKPEIWAYSSAG